MRRAATPLLTAALAAGCYSPGSDPAIPTTSRDSAGVEYVDYASMPALSSRVVSDSGVAMGPAEEFGVIIAASFLPDGRVIVTDVSNYRFGIFAPSGELVRWIGREGSGPLEFRNLAWARPFGDSIMAYDRALRRLSVTDSAGRLGRMLTLRSPAEGLAPEAVTVLGDGGILVSSTGTVMAGVEPGIHRPPLQLWRYAPDGTPVAPVGPPLLAQEWVKLADPQVLMPRPFGAEALLAAAPQLVHVVDAGAAVLTSLTADGRVVRRVSLPLQPQPAGARIARYREQQVEAARRNGRPGAVAAAERQIDAIPFPETVPVFRRIVVDAERRIWLQSYPGPQETGARFLVLAPDGLLLDQVDLPRGRVLFDAMGEHLLVRRTDAEGAQWVWLVRY